MSTILDNLDILNKYIALVTFSVTFILESALFIKLRFNMDKAAIAQLLIYLVSMLVRCLEYIANPIDKTLVGLVRIIASHLSWILIYYMIFEMMHIRAKILSENVQELVRVRKRIDLHQIVVFGVIFLFYSIPSILIYDPIIEVNDTTYKGLLLVRLLAKLPIDAYLFPSFVSLFILFIKKKVQSLQN